MELVGKMAMRGDMAGRPTNGTKQFQVQLDPAAVARVDALVGTYKRSEFIRDAIERELARRSKA
jgi:metal-responsive CopG/Arc/MetJ family transcriptional regulator